MRSWGRAERPERWRYLSARVGKMKSPKFRLKRADIQAVINVLRLKNRWKVKVRDAMRKQPMPDIVEHLDFHVKLEANCVAIEAEVCSASYKPRAPIKFLHEKSKGLCRQLVVPSVRDALVLQTLSDALWDEIRQKAPSKNAFYAPSDHGFSNVIKGHSSEYGSIAAWIAFQQAIFGFTSNHKFIVSTDIANYYDCISYDHLRNILAGMSIAKEHSLDLLLYTLSEMLWQPDYMPRVHIGLPQVNLDAPRLLAHAFLFEIDHLLASDHRIDFARYMDDIDIGVDDIAVAKEVLRDLDLALQTRQIRLNSGKTKILSDQEARSHFCIKENVSLTRLEQRIQRKLNQQKGISVERQFLPRYIDKGLMRQSFERGNGEKILKRAINYARLYSANVSNKAFETILRDWPTVRSTALLWWIHLDNPLSRLETIRDFMVSGHIVDDAAIIDIATSVVNAKLPANLQSDLLVNDIINQCDPTRIWGFYARAWLLSKYGTASALMQLIEKSTSLWVTEEYLSRLVGGLFPRFLGTSHEGKFIAIVVRAGSTWATDVMEFHQRLATSIAGYTSVKSFVSARNPSLPNRISHSKLLMLHSLLANPTIAPTAVQSLRQTHRRALADPWYRMW